MKIRILPWPIFTLLVASATAFRMDAGTFAEVNWALTGTASQSSDLDGVHVASLAIDGNTDGAWTHGSVTHTGNTDDPPWWEVELGGMKPIGRVQVWFRTDCCQSRNDDFTLSVLDGQRNEVWRRTYPGRPPTTVSYDFAPAIQGEIIRVEGQTPRTTSDGYLALAEVQVIAPYPNIAITVTQNPTNATIFEGHSATFGPVAAVASDTNIPPDKFTIQWQKNGVAIVGADGATYTTPLELVSDNGAQFAATFTLPGAMAVSAKATLTVIQDLVPPLVSSVSFAGGTTLQFSV